MKIISLLFLCLCSLFVHAQTCKVFVDALNGEYKGDCVKGKADGQGSATGIDSYTGHFKKGLPDGYGKYTWQNGNIYEGYWKMGLSDGAGTMTMHISGEKDSIQVLTGFWNKGKFIGKYEKPYFVRSFSNGVNNVTVKKLNTSGGAVSVIVKNMTGGAATLSERVLSSKSQLVGVQLVEGMYLQQIADESSSPVQNKYTFREVTFPFYAVLSFKTNTPGPERAVERVGIEINENGSWSVQVGIDN